MDLFRAPLRISYVGGGTDYPAFYNQHGGGVIAAAIDQFVYLYAHPLSEMAEENLRFTYRETESVLDVNDLKHPVLREMLREANWKTRTNFGTFSDLPSGVGLGGSSSFSVALATLVMDKQNFPLVKHEIARLAVRIEREVLKESGGIQDQYVASFGSIREYQFTSEDVKVTTPLLDPLDISYLNDRQILLWLDETRHSNNFANQTVEAIKHSNGALLDTLRLFEATSQAIQKSTNSEGKYNAITEAVKLGWELKKHYIAELSPQIKNLETYFNKSGDVSFKLCGAGGAGFLLILAEPDVLQRIKSMLTKRKFISPKIETNGTQKLSFSRQM